MKQPLVSIILTSYNFESYIGQSISSLLNQSINTTIEFIIVDDSSKDRSPSIIKDFASHHENITFIHHPINKGASYSINEAFALARGKYLCRFDGDDSWDVDFLKKMVAILEEHTEVGLAYCNCSYINLNGEITNRDVPTRRKTTSIIAHEFNDLLTDYYITAPT
ncbi:MAG: glycosyltransferase family 2 protein, partial [Pedobacter sp.]